MRDLSAALLPAEGPISRARHREVMAAAAGLHAAFRGERFEGAITLERHLGISSPAVAEAERDGSDVIPKQLETAWEAFAYRAARRTNARRSRQPARPGPLARAARSGTHARARRPARRQPRFADGRHPARLGHRRRGRRARGRVVPVPRRGARRPRATSCSGLLAAEDGAVSERDLDLGLIAGLQLYGWIFGHSAVIHPDPPSARGRARARVVGPAGARRARAHGRAG
jgi:hypothetical protein